MMHVDFRDFRLCPHCFSGKAEVFDRDKGDFVELTAKCTNPACKYSLTRRYTSGCFWNAYKTLVSQWNGEAE